MAEESQIPESSEDEPEEEGETDDNQVEKLESYKIELQKCAIVLSTWSTSELRASKYTKTLFEDIDKLAFTTMQLMSEIDCFLQNYKGSMPYSTMDAKVLKNMETYTELSEIVKAFSENTHDRRQLKRSASDDTTTATTRLKLNDEADD